MKEQNLKEIIQLIEKFRSGVSLNKLLSEEPKWDKRTLQRRLRELTLKNKVIKLGRGRAVLYLISDKDKFPKVPYLKKKEEGTRKYAIFPLEIECKWDFLSKYITVGASSSIKKCAKAILTHSSRASYKNALRLEGNSRQFSDIKRISKEKSDVETHKILNPKVDFIVLNI